MRFVIGGPSDCSCNQFMGVHRILGTPGSQGCGKDKAWHEFVWLFAMNVVSLRVIVVIEVVLAVMACATGMLQHDWQSAPRELLTHSPDAYHSIAILIARRGFLGGACIGMGVCAATVAVSQRKSMGMGSANLYVYWLAIALPPLAILWIYLSG